jgi:hypothetical protein
MLCLFNFLVLNIIIVNGNENVWRNIFVNHIRQINPYQITIFRNSSVSMSVEEDFVIKDILILLPTVIIDVSNTKLLNNSSIVKMPAFEYPRKTTIYVVFLSKLLYSERFHLEDFKNLLEFLVSISPRTIRPKCLLLYLKSSSLSKSWLQSILRYAWFMRFLDFSIIRIHSKYDDLLNTTMYYYNPFTSNFYGEIYTSKTELFPDKLIDMKGYVLKIPFIYMPPLMTVSIFNESFIFDGDGIKLLRSFGEVINYTIQVIVTETIPPGNLSLKYLIHNSSTLFKDKIQNLVKSLRDNKFEMAPVPLYPTGLFMYEENIEKSIPFIFDKFGILVSVTAMVKVDTSFTAFCDYMINMCIVLMFILVSYWFKLPKESFGYLALIGVSLGQATKAPKKSSERIIFFCIVFLSLTHFSNIFANVTETHVKTYELPLSTAADVEKSKMLPQINEGFFANYFKDSDNQFKNLKLKLQIVKGNKNCFQSLQKNTKILCFTSKSKAQDIIKSREKTNGCPLLRFSEFEFFSVRSNLYFEQGSPYVEKFNWFVQRFLDSGVFQLWEHNHKEKSVCFEDKINHLNIDKHSHIMKQSISILICGYTLSVLAFATEILLSPLTKKKLFNI